MQQFYDAAVGAGAGNERAVETALSKDQPSVDQTTTYIASWT
jgi:hypothetical protein